MDFSTQRLEKIANRVAALERIFNLEAGMKPEDDSLPERFITEPILVKGKEKLISRDVIEKLRYDYYKAQGWDEQGRPSQRLRNSLKIKGIRK